MAAEENFATCKAELERLNRLYFTLRRMHQAILREPSRQQLFERICQSAVEMGGFRLSFVGWIDPRSLQVIPLAKAGGHAAYLDRAVMHADERPTGMGPIGICIRSQQTYICNDYFNDPTTEYWRTFAAEHGFRSVAIFPIREGGRVRGVFTLYSGELNFFRDREVQLLEEAAADISYALDNFVREEQRRKAETVARRMDALVQASSDAILSESLDGTIQSWNDAAERMYGYRADEMIGQKILRLVPEDLWAATLEMHGQVCAGRSFAGIETERLHKSGMRFPVAITLSPIRNRQGEVIGVSKIAHDISEQNASLASLQESAGLLGIMINEAPTGLAMLDRECRVLATSRRWVVDNGLAGVDVLGRTLEELFPEAPQLWRAQFEQVLNGDTIEVPEERFTRPDGAVRWLSRRLRPWMTGTGEIGGIVILSEDVTEQKLADDARRRSEEFLKIFIEDTPVALAMFDRELRYLGANQCWRRDTGQAGQQLIGRLRYEVNAEIPERWKEADRRALAGEIARCEEDCFVRADGTQMWLRWEVRPWYEADGAVGGILIFAEDITARKLAEVAQHEAEAQLRLVVDNLDDGLFVTTPEGRLITWNPAARRIYGIPDQGFELFTLADYPSILTLYAEDGSVVATKDWPMARILRGERIRNVEMRSRSKFIDHDLYLSYAGTMVELGDGRKLGFMRCQDLTLRRRMEQQLRESQERFEAVMNSLDEGLVIVDEDGQVLSWNPVVARVLGYTLAEKPGFRAEDFLASVEVLDLDGNSLPAGHTPMRRILDGEELRGEVYQIRVRSTGRIYTFSYFGALVALRSGARLAFIKFREIATAESSGSPA